MHCPYALGHIRLWMDPVKLIHINQFTQPLKLVSGEDPRDALLLITSSWVSSPAWSSEGRAVEMGLVSAMCRVKLSLAQTHGPGQVQALL